VGLPTLTPHKWPVQDVTAAMVALLLVAAVSGLALLDRPIPSELSVALGSAVTWLFVRSTQVAEQATNGRSAPEVPARVVWPTPTTAGDVPKPDGQDGDS